ncbi:UDP-N-acetylglucosamine 2-epimerase (non-hydrolyzing) [Candidatus Woesearchaeota archaeon]|nr:UDP-N-acetylglucosamine 2-epimerase (non-hydrolyzing) [Candidatus Woesearchaeota archaeon]
MAVGKKQQQKLKGRFKVVSLFGIRSDIIKMSTIFPLLDKSFNHIMVHSNQHYDYNMDRIFFSDLHLREPDYNLNTGSGTHAGQTSKIMLSFEKILLDEKPDAVIVQGDTNTTMAGAIVASKLNLPLFHIEGGCRGFAKNEPEEINRKVSDQLSDLIFVPDKESVENLRREGFEQSRIFLSGNTSYDVCMRNVKYANDDSLEKFGVEKGKFAAATIHRSQNTASKERLGNILAAFEEVSYFCPVVFPVHPRTQAAAKRFGLSFGKLTKAIEPIGYLEFLGLMKNARMIITDSASIQEEAVFLNVPCLVAYNETPWVPYVRSGKNELIGWKKSGIVAAARKLFYDGKHYNHIRSIPFDRYPDTSEKIVKNILSWLKARKK